jgi:hypothetical protein
VRKLETALDRQKLAGAFFFTIPGPKMMWQFGELGYGGGPRECLKSGSGDGDCLASDPGRTARKPIRWDYRDEPNRYDLYKTWSELIRLRHVNPVFSDPATQVNIQSSGPVKHIRLLHDTNAVLVVGNFGVTTQNGSVTFPETGTWYVFGTDDTMEITTTTQNFRLDAGEYRILSKNKLQHPDEEPPVTSIHRIDDLPGTFALYPNYPNPFNPTTQIQFSLPQTTEVKLEVFSLLGQRLATLVNETRSMGEHTVSFDGKDLSSGVYVYRLVTPEFSQSKTMQLIK